MFGKLYLTNYGLAHLTKCCLGNLTNRNLQGVTLQKLACQTGPKFSTFSRTAQLPLSPFHLLIPVGTNTVRRKPYDVGNQP